MLLRHTIKDGHDPPLRPAEWRKVVLLLFYYSNNIPYLRIITKTCNARSEAYGCDLKRSEDGERRHCRLCGRQSLDPCHLLSHCLRFCCSRWRRRRWDMLGSIKSSESRLVAHGVLPRGHELGGVFFYLGLLLCHAAPLKLLPHADTHPGGQSQSTMEIKASGMSQRLPCLCHAAASPA